MYGRGRAPKLAPPIVRHELNDDEWTPIKPMLLNKPRSVRRANDRLVLNGIRGTASTPKSTTEVSLVPPRRSGRDTRGGWLLVSAAMRGVGLGVLRTSKMPVVIVVAANAAEATV